MLLTIVSFLVILTVLVLIHEFGHFMAARIIGVRVEEFGLGLPPMIFGKKIGDTIYSLNWLPIGGFVRLAGEDEAGAVKSGVSMSKQRQYFWARSKKERAVILSAGVLMNFLLAVGITMFLLVHGVKEPVGRIHVESVMAGTPASAAGFQVNDILSDLTVVSTTLQQITIHHPTETGDVIQFTHTNAGKSIDIVVERSGVSHHLSLVPRANPPKGQGPMGIAISNLEVHRYSMSEAPGKALFITFTRVRDMLVSLGTTVARLATLRAPQSDVAGPIGIAQVTGQAVKFGWEAVLEFASILSLNLAVLNILPIPALDGGRLAFVFLEKIFRRRVNPVFERNAHQIGMIVLLVLIVLVSINDILRLARGG